jgi:transposase
MMPYINVDLDDISDEELIDELESRNIEYSKDPEIKEIVQLLYDKISTKQDYTKDLNYLIYHVLGRIV